MDALITGALATGREEGKAAKREALSEEAEAVAEEEALLAAGKAKRKGGEEKKKGEKAGVKKLHMSSAGGDSYAECFPDSHDQYNLELHGPDSDDEAGVVRGKEEEEPEEEEEDKGGRRVPKREAREAQKREAKFNSELVQIEKLMEERAAKRRKRDEGEQPDDGPVDQNELF